LIFYNNLFRAAFVPKASRCNYCTVRRFVSGDPNLSLTMNPFSISTDEHLPLKFIMTKYFIILDKFNKKRIMIFGSKFH